LVPEASFDAARRWDQSLLTFGETGQRCDRFNVDVPLRAESEIRLGAATWRVIAAKGHDPNAVMLFEPVSRILISADALWEARLAIVFPEVDGVGGFGETRATLDLIGELQPRLVIPGHGPAFTDVARALDRSLDKLALFERHPERHLHYATRALTMFHMLDVRGTTRKELSEWLQATPIFARLHLRLDAQRMDLGNFSASVVEQLIADGLLMQFGDCEISLHSA
jgi:glyoxylase-like metal-dependent hydrolase (beta-lactamase superfamily II)